MFKYVPEVLLALKNTKGEIGADLLYLYKNGKLRKVISIKEHISEFLEENYDDLFYDVEDLGYIQKEEYADMFITLQEIKNYKKKQTKENTVYDSDNVRYVYDENTLLIPCSNLLYLNKELPYPFYIAKNNQLLPIPNYHGNLNELRESTNIYHLFNDLNSEEKIEFEKLVVTFGEILDREIPKL